LDGDNVSRKLQIGLLLKRGRLESPTSRSLKIAGNIVFGFALVLTVGGIISPAIALALGLFYGLTFPNGYHSQATRVSRLLLQASIVGLGFSMDLHEVIRVGSSGFLYTAVSIAVSVALGLCLGFLLSVGRAPSLLITVGTAICGGSAIAAVGPVTNATDEEMAVSLGTVFLLNSVALIVFPTIGWMTHLNETQFGLWSALAIHDTSSVVGATARYGKTALVVGTTVKLTRALWIIPVTLVAAVLAKARPRSRTRWPWFIALFVLAACINTYLPALRNVCVLLARGGRVGLTMTLFLIGAGLTLQSLGRVGIRPLIQGLVLWIVLAAAWFSVIRMGWIGLG
jgi:uncharacterized integral membrane protein (TIGR00698 family)